MHHLNRRTLAWLAAFMVAVIGVALLADEGARMDEQRVEATP